MRTVRLALGEQEATTSTTLVVAEARDELTLRLDHAPLGIETARVDGHRLADGVLRFEGVAAGARISVTGRVAYRSRPHGLARLVDPADGSAYIVASGALGGAAHFVAAEDGPADRLTTTMTVTGAGGDVLATGEHLGPHRFVSRTPLASHQLALAAGPWRRYADGPVSLLARRSLARPEAVATLLGDTRRVLAWLTAWFGGPGPWGAAYAQVLLPDPPWLAMEHPDCVLVSERLLEDAGDVPRGRRVAVLAHEVAHQWLGNLVSPRRWEDVGVFEGMAELLGQLACEELLGPSAAPFLERRRAAGPLVVPPAEPEAPTAGLAEVAGPVQHAELFRQARAEIGARAFRERILLMCRSRAGGTAGTAEVWSALGLEVRRPPRLRLPAVAGVERGPLRRRWEALGGLDPATAAARAREAFRAAAPGPDRVRAALAAVADPSTSPAVASGLGAELAGGLPGGAGAFPWSRFDTSGLED